MRKTKQLRRQQIKEKGARSFREYKKLMNESPIDPELEMTRQLIDATASLDNNEPDVAKITEELDKVLEMAKDQAIEELSEKGDIDGDIAKDVEEVIKETGEPIEGMEDVYIVKMSDIVKGSETVRTCDGEHQCGEHQCDCKYSDEDKVEYQKPEVLEKQEENVPKCEIENKI